MDKRCVNCRFCRKLKEHVKGKWIIKSCCTFFAETEPDGGYDSFVIVVNADRDMCECFNKRKETSDVRKLTTSAIEEIVAEFKNAVGVRSVVCSPIVKKVLEMRIPKIDSNILIFDTPHLNNTDSVYVFNGDISDPKYILPTEFRPMFDAGDE